MRALRIQRAREENKWNLLLQLYGETICFWSFCALGPVPGMEIMNLC